MVIQRLSDLLWMGQGVMKIGQAHVRLSRKRCEHLLKNSSVFQSVTETRAPKDEHDMTAEEMDAAFKDVDFDIANEIETSSSGETGVNSSNSVSTTGTITQKREFGTSCNCQCKRLPHNLPSIRSHLHSLTRTYHTTSLCYAITAEELAKVAELAKSKRKNEEGPGNGGGRRTNLKQQLSERAKETRVPSSRIGRVASFGGLAAGLMLGTVSEMAKKSFSGPGDTEGSNTSGVMKSASSFLSDANMERIVNTLCRVRGAALKLGQMLSIQDDSIIDPKLLEVFDRVRQSADFMPASQMKKVLVQQLGKDWQDKLAYFEEKPFAAASIGQVHRAVLHDGREVAMKIQYPGVANSINSDINNLVTLLKLWNLFPERFFIDQFIAVARHELALECDYEREARYFHKFRELLVDDERYDVPAVIPELSTKQVITTEMVYGMPLDKVQELDQETRNNVASAMLSLQMREIFEFRMMQTDPNWSNFLYDPEKKKINLLDFGASREYPERFVDDYIEVVHAASIGDRDTVLQKSRSLKFLTGYETKVMEEAHIDAVMIVGEPFTTKGEFDFGKQDTTRRIARLVPTMLEHRLTPPPEESYSLHRKLSGCFLLAAKLKSKFQCRDVLHELYQAHHARKKSLS